MSKGGSQPAGNTTTTQVAQPWSGAIPYITSGLSSAQNLYAQGGPQYYPGQTYAPENTGEMQSIAGLENAPSTYAPLQNMAQGVLGNAVDTSGNVTNNSNSIFNLSGSLGGNASNIYSQAQGIAGQTAGNNPSNSFFTGLATGNNSSPGLGTLQNFSNGSMLSAQNPYFSQMANTVTGQVLPGINAQFANSGDANSGLAARAAGLGVGDAVGNLAYNNYEQGLTQQQNAANSLAGFGVQGAQGLSNNYQNSIANQLAAGTLGLNATNAGINAGNLGLAAGNQAINAGSLGLNAANLAPELQAMGINANNAALGAGQVQQSLDQQPITAAMNQWNYNQALPYQNLQNYIGNITGQIGGTGSSATTSPYFQNGLANTIGGLLGGSMLGNQLLGSSSGGLFGSIGAGLGSLFGGGAAAGAGADVADLALDTSDLAVLGLL